MTRSRQRGQRDDLRENLGVAMQAAPNPKALMEEFDSLESAWTPPEKTGFESASQAA